jgi:hypothetical protein
MTDTILRANWDGHPILLGTALDLRLRKGQREHPRGLRAADHQLGHELVLRVDGELTHSAVCRSKDEFLGLYEQWRAALIEKGWG